VVIPAAVAAASETAKKTRQREFFMRDDDSRAGAELDQGYTFDSAWRRTESSCKR
jgi:hypothetical protein